MIALRDPAPEPTKTLARHEDRPIAIIVDDDPDVLGSLQFALEVDGFEVRAHSDPFDLLAHRALPGVGCLIIDQQMPGIDGLTLLSRLRARGCALPAVMITTPNAAVSKLAADAGVEIVEKPLLCDTLISRVRALLSAEDSRECLHG